MKNLFAFLVLALSVACGEYADDYEGGLGEAEQALTGKVTPTFAYGAQTGQARQQCNKTSTGQVCAVPKFKKIQLAYTAANFTTGQITNMSDILGAFNAVSNFDYVGPVDPSASIPANTVRMLVGTGSCAGASSSSTIEAFSCVNVLSSLTNLTEGTGVVGAYQHFGGCAVTLDVSDINARGSDSFQDERLFKQAFAHAAGVCSGIGSISTAAANNHLTRRNIELSASLQLAPTPGQVCLMDAYSDLSDLTNYDLVTPACSAD